MLACKRLKSYVLDPDVHAVRVYGAADHHRQLHRAGPGGAPAGGRQDTAGAAAGELPHDEDGVLGGCGCWDDGGGGGGGDDDGYNGMILVGVVKMVVVRIMMTMVGVVVVEVVMMMMKMMIMVVVVVVLVMMRMM